MNGLLAAIQETAGRWPGRPAVIGSGGGMSYGELVERSERLATALAERGVGRGDRVGILLAPGAGAVVAMVAALMIDGAYVPLDPEQPMRRTLSMLENCGAKVCVGESAPAAGPCPFLTAEARPAGSCGLAGNGPRPDSVAYVIHTSGSTGTPKGVQVEHRSVLNLVAELDRLAPVPAGCRGSWWTRPSFDVSVWESWAPLMRGGTVLVVPDECRLEGPRLARFLTSAGIHSAYVPGAFLPDLLEHWKREPAGEAGLARLLVGVEPIALGVLQDLMEVRPGLTIVNGYGPAETTICCTLHVVARSGGNRAERTPIGRAVTGNRLYLLDEQGHPTTADAGELAVAGIGVARGYLGATAGESARFIPDPGGLGARAYRTGDLARALPDGNLVFEGRVDRQLKVRGYRVEPGEVEAALRVIVPLRDVAIGKRELVAGEASIVAYVVPAAGVDVDTNQMTARLGELLPPWAVPSLVIGMERLPLRPNGKIDHDALAAIPAPPPRPASRPEPVAARQLTSTAERARVDQLWARALASDGEETGFSQPDVPFSVVGGHSLAAAQIVAAVRAEFGRRISIAEVLRADPTLDELAVLVAAAPPADLTEEGPGDAARAAAQAHRRAPLSRSMQPVWAFHRMYPESPAYNVLRVLSIAGRVDPAALRAAALSLARRHDALRCSIDESRPAHPELVAHPSVMPSVSTQAVRIGPGGISATADWETTAPPAVEMALRAAADRPFDMAAAPLWRLHVVYVPQLNRTWLLLAAHHLIADLRTSDVLLIDLARMYEAHLSGRPADEARASSLVTHLLAEADAGMRPGERERRTADLEWWVQTLGERPEARPLPLSDPQARNDDYAADTQSLSLGTSTVEELARALRVTNATVLLTAALIVLASWRGRGDAPVAGLPSARPAGAEGADVAGFLVDTVPIQVVVEPGRTFAELCREVRSTYLDALDHASATLGDIMARLAIPRQSPRSSIIDLWFNDLEYARRPARFGDARAVEYDLVQSWALFRCGLYIRRGEAGFRLHGVVPQNTMRTGDLRALLRQIRDLVGRAARHHGRPVAELLAPPRPLLPPRLLPAGPAIDTSIHEIAGRFPDAIAVHSGEGTVTFAQLSADVRARARDWDSTCRVALGARNDYAHIVNLLAAVAAGASAVLIDRHWPVQRQRAAIRISGATQAAAIEPGVLAGVQFAPRATGLGGIAIQFTSGSTGSPLAVATPAEVIWACIEDLGRWLGVRADDRASFISGAAHDPSWRDICLPLRAGATLFIPPEDVHRDPAQLVPWVRENRITLVNTTPPLLALALETAASHLPDLRLLVTGGAPLPAALARRIREVAPQATVINGYGCTETPQLLTALRLGPGDEIPARGDLSIGKPLPGRAAQVRTSAGAACDVGQLGTIWAGAPHIASGYAGPSSDRSPAAAARFMTDADGMRWFDTGDLARVDSAGNLTLAGRADRQRLVNGHRVVLDEIESLARAHPDIDAAIVEVVTTESAETLHIFVRPAKGAAITEAKVRETLRSQLPAAVVPTRIIVTDELPLSSNLKPQIPARPADAAVEPGGSAPVMAPAITALAESILGGPLRSADNFFEAGFTSITLLQLSAELSRLLGLEIPAVMMFRYPSLQRLLPQLDVQPPAMPGRGPASPEAEGGGIRDRRRQLRRSIARQLGEGQG